MNVVMIIPTGIGCAIGGHAGDATPAAKLLASCCDKLILHPNVVNASDINEMPENSLYVEGSILDRFLEGEIELQEIRQNKVLVVVNPPVGNHTINAVSAARVTIGLNAEIVELKYSLMMYAKMENGRATGEVDGYIELVQQVQKYKFDALALATPITVSNEVMIEYFKNGGVNPIGGVEAKASRLIADKLNKPVAHAPFEEWCSELWKYNEVVDPRLGAEMVSTCFLHCVLKGLHKAPRIGKGLSIENVDVMVSPHGCWGRPHEACLEAEILIIEVLENQTILNVQIPTNYYVEKRVIIVANYLEAAGMLMAMKAGINPKSVRRPMEWTKIIKGVTE